MKTKTNLFLRFILKILFTFFIGFFINQTFADLTNTGAYDKLTAGLMGQYYDVTWCSPHADRLKTGSNAPFKNGNCQKGNFFKKGGTSIGMMTYTGDKFKYGSNVKINIKKPSDFIVQTRVSDIGLIDFFDVNTIQFEGEGTYTIKIVLFDYAYNASIFYFTYKVDKTAPQFALTGFTEIDADKAYIFAPELESGNTNSEKRLAGFSGSILKFDSNIWEGIGIVMPSGNGINDLEYYEKYIDPPINKYSGEIPIEKSGHIRNNLYVIYFSTGSKEFQVDTKYSERYFNNYMTGGHALISGVSKIELLEEDSNLIKTLEDNIINSYENPDKKITINTTYLISHGQGQGENTQKKYKLRIYDKTTGKVGANNEKPNYSEIIFYAVRDNIKPNMGGNGLAGTDSKKAIESLLIFTGTTIGDFVTVYDTGTLNYDPEIDGAVSKFISATDSQKLYSKIADIGITGNGKTTLTTSSGQYARYNSGIPYHDTKINIENTGSLNNFEMVFDYTSRFINFVVDRKKDFSLVDNYRFNGYRKYKTKFDTTGITTEGICDNVGNCLEPELEFRVVANELANATSNISVDAPEKVFANGKDKYTITAKFEDKYGNKIVGVKAIENGTAPMIKFVDTYFDFENTLYSDQHSVNPDTSGTKLAIVKDEENDNISTETETGTVNTSSSIHFGERAEFNGGNESADGTYKFSIASKVPTSGLYPYLDAKIKLTKIRPKAISLQTNNIGFYPTINSALGLFNKQTTDHIEFNGNGNNLFIYNKAFLTSSEYQNDFVLDQKDEYGKISYEEKDVKFNEFLNISDKKLELEFASPVVYGGENFTINHLINNSSIKEHKKIAYNFETSIIPKDSITIYEKYLPSYNSPDKLYTPGKFDIYSNYKNLDISIFNTSNINSGTGIKNLFLSDLTTGSGIFNTKSLPASAGYSSTGGLNMGYVSYLEYNIDGSDIKIPSISRNVSDKVSGGKDPEQSSNFFFPVNSYITNNGTDDYVILGDPVIAPGAVEMGMGIGITGLSNNNNGMIINEYAGKKANLNVGENLTRYDLMSIFKQNVIKNSAGFGDNKKWCEITGLEINQDELNAPLNNNLEDCTITTGSGEIVSFIKGNVKIDCSGTCLLNDNLKRTIIVKDGSTYIKSNISTYNNKQLNSQLLIGTIAEAGLSNVDIPNNNPPITHTDTKFNGWTFIDPSITNIDAFIVSQGPMVSYDGISLYDSPLENDLKNQLHIYGSTLSLNTIGGLKDDTSSKCPYIISNTNTCNQLNAFIFDLIKMRAYSLEGSGALSDKLVPSGYTMPNSNKRSGGLSSSSGCDIIFDKNLGTNGKVVSDNCATITSGDLRRITDKDYIVYPLFVERDTSWNKSPSVMFKIDN